MKPFPKMEDYDHEYADIIDVELPAYHRARADWYASEVVPLLREAEAMLCDVRGGKVANELAQRIVTALRELEG